MRRDLKAYHQPRVVEVPAGRHHPNPPDQFTPVPLNLKLTPLHLLQEDPQTLLPHQRDQKLSQSVRCYGLMPQECSPKDHSYTLRYLLRSSYEMLEALVFMAGVATATYTSMLFRQLVLNCCDSVQRSLEPLVLYPGRYLWEMFTLALNARRCSVPLMAWRYMPDGLTMGSGHLLVSSVARRLDTKLVWVSIGEYLKCMSKRWDWFFPFYF